MIWWEQKEEILRCYGLSAIHDDISFVTGAGAGATAAAAADAAAAATAASAIASDAAFATTAAANTAAVTAATTQPLMNDDDFILIQIGPLTPFDKGIFYGVRKPWKKVGLFKCVAPR